MTNDEIKIQPNYYAIIPAEVRYCDIPPNAKLLYGEITALCNKEGYCWASNQYFATLYRVSKFTISDWVKILKDKGFIKYEIADKTTRKIYLTLAENSKGVSEKEQGGVSEKEQHNTTSVNTKNNTFGEFWKIYPKKVEKKKAEAKWNRLNKTTQDLVLADLAKRTKTEQWIKADGQFVPNPMTYLNGERWNDQITTANPPASIVNYMYQREMDASLKHMEEQRADENSPAKQKFKALKEKFKIGKTI